MDEGQATMNIPVTTGAPGAEIPAGYKRTEAGVVPTDWDAVSLGELFAFKNGLNKAKRFFGNGTPIVNYMDVFERPGLTIENLSGRVSLDSQEIKNFRVRRGDVFFTRTSETVEDVGIASVMLDEPDDTVFSGFVLRARSRDGRLDNRYKQYCFAPRTIRSQITSSTTYTTRALTNGRSLSAVQIAIPPEPEQRAIAEVLSDIDGLIESLKSLIAKKQAIKAGTMQQLLTGKIRLPEFSGKWRREFIGQIGFIYNGLSGKSKTDFRRGHAKYVTFLSVLDHVLISIDSLSFFDNVAIGSEEKQNKVLSGDLLFNNTSETPDDLAMGSAVQVDIPELYLNSFCFGFRLYNSSRYNPLYLAYSFRGPIGRKLMYALAQGATRYNISKQQFLNLELRIPEIREQIAIATILSDMDAEIAALERRLNKIRAIKQNAMQQLLTGRIRLARPL